MAISRYTETVSPERHIAIRPPGQALPLQLIDFTNGYSTKLVSASRVEWNGTKAATYVFKKQMNDPVRRDEKGTPVDDESAVRERSASARPVAPSSPPPRSAPPFSSGAARERLEEKLRQGRSILAGLPAGDDRARLLHVAIMRRDESLLDGVLAALGQRDGKPPSGR
jgi:hypothetical protein